MLDNQLHASTSFYPNTDNTTYWNAYGNGSASEYLASSFTPDNIMSNVAATMDCSKSMVHIQTLEQRVKSLEEQVNALVSNRNMALNSSTHSTTQPLAHQMTVFPESYSRPEFAPAVPASILEAPTANSSLENQTSSQEVELVPGYGLRISVPQMDTCLRKAKASGTALTRLLCNVLFEDEVLARSSARGTKTRPALDSNIVNAIIKFVELKRKLTETEVVQAINQKCSDCRTSLKPVASKK